MSNRLAIPQAPRVPARRAAAQAPAKRSAADLQRLDRQLCFALYSSSLVMTKLYKPVLAPLGLTYPQYLVMLALWEFETLGVGELGERLFLDSGTLTPLLKRLEVAGLLTRERASDDERRVIVTLTTAGKALARKAGSVPMHVAGATGCKLRELADLTAQLQALRSNLAGHLDPVPA